MTKDELREAIFKKYEDYINTCDYSTSLKMFDSAAEEMENYVRNFTSNEYNLDISTEPDPALEDFLNQDRTDDFSFDECVAFIDECLKHHDQFENFLAKAWPENEKLTDEEIRQYKISVGLE